MRLKKDWGWGGGRLYKHFFPREDLNIRVKDMKFQGGVGIPTDSMQVGLVVCQTWLQ